MHFNIIQSWWYLGCATWYRELERVRSQQNKQRSIGIRKCTILEGSPLNYHLIHRLKLKKNLCLFQQERKSEPKLPIGDFRWVENSKLKSDWTCASGATCEGIKDLKYVWQAGMSNSILCKNNSLVPHCGVFNQIWLQFL